jgi:hypothetical protein
MIIKSLQYRLQTVNFCVNLPVGKNKNIKNLK